MNDRLASAEYLCGAAPGDEDKKVYAFMNKMYAFLGF
jgi:hypothetical protein